MLFLRVCRTWRDIALSSPELWSTLQLQIERVDPGNGVVLNKTSMIEAYIHRWFGQAAQRPLFLGFRREDDHDEPLGDCEFPTGPMGDIIRHYSHRLQSLELSLSQDDLDELGMDTMDFPLLQRATLGYAHGPDPDPHDPV
ncbi:hypothetical protein DFH06DRAFT_1464154, partial [Mycena polygramma]